MKAEFHQDLKLARFIPTTGASIRVTNVVRRFKMPAARTPSDMIVENVRARPPVQSSCATSVLQTQGADGCGGASAGGGLTAALALLSHDLGEMSPVYLLMSYPVLDDRASLRTDRDDRNVRLYTAAAHALSWRWYLGLEPGGPDVLFPRAGVTRAFRDAQLQALRQAPFASA